MEARYQLRQSPWTVGGRPVHNLTDPTFEAPGGLVERIRCSVEEDRQPARVVSMKEYGPEYAIEDQVHADDVRQ
jgi:hypothetical protein